MTGIHHITMKTLKEEMPNVGMEDVLSLIKDLECLSDNQRAALKAEEGAPDSTQVKTWTPSRETVRELIRGQVRVVDLMYCINDFRGFAESKGWHLKDNLDAKLIGHVKIMAQNGKITFDGE